MPDPTVDDGRNNRFVTIDVAAEALGVGKRRAREIAKEEHWRTGRGTRPTQYSFADIVRTYNQRTGAPQ